MSELQQLLANSLIASAIRVGIIVVLALVALAITRRLSELIEQRLRARSDLAPTEGQKRLLARR